MRYAVECIRGSVGNTNTQVTKPMISPRIMSGRGDVNNTTLVEPVYFCTKKQRPDLI